MSERLKNGKLIGCFVLLMVLCVGLLIKGKTGKMLEPDATPIQKEPLVLSNVWLMESGEKSITVLCDGEKREYWLPKPLPEPLSGCIVDIVVEEGCVTGLTVQRDTIEAKVLRIGTDFIELEGYGKVGMEEGSRVYRMYDSIKELTWLDVLVGYTTSEFVLSGDKVCAALVKEPVQVTGIRVLLQNSSYGGFYHETVECGSEEKFYFSDGSGRTEWMEGGGKLTITKELVEDYGGRLYLGTEKAEGKMSLYNVRRAVGVPSYRGTLEVAILNDNLIVINELSLEEYLYGVLPSEMPASFGMEALKAQAVCARSYACNQLMANRYCAYGAHVDDSVNCQVYQNYGENEATIEAVKATFGKVLSQNGKCITAYYFSCSYGHTSDSEDIWGNQETTVLIGVAQNATGSAGNLNSNKKFEEYLDSDREWYDTESVWFRWSTILGEELNELILKRLKERQQIAPETILMKVGETEAGERFAEQTVEKFGTLKDIIVAERGNSGVVTKLLLVGSEATYLLLREYSIRYVLAPLNTVYLQDGSITSNLNLLPSGYFVVEKKPNYFIVRGGGHGHGSGMSQYGAKYLASKGKSFEEILMHFYKDTEISYLYR